MRGVQISRFPVFCYISTLLFGSAINSWVQGTLLNLLEIQVFSNNKLHYDALYVL